MTVVDTAVELTWRPLTSEDAAAWQVLLAAVEAVDRTGENYDVTDLAEELVDPLLDPARDTLGAFVGPVLVAYGKVSGRKAVRDADRLSAEGAVHPDFRGRGIGSAVVDWQIRRATAMHLERFPDVPGEVQAHTFEPNTGQGELYAAHGFAAARWFHEMDRDLRVDAGEPSEPAEGVRVVPFDPSHDDDVRLAHCEAFADHWGTVPPDVESWGHWFTGHRAFRSALSFVALAGTEVAGYLLGYEQLADAEAKGYREAWAGQIGTRRPWRHQGIAAALLSRFLVAARGEGHQAAVLAVDAANPTGALGLYERHGFTKVRTFVRYVLPL